MNYCLGIILFLMTIKLFDDCITLCFSYIERKRNGKKVFLLKEEIQEVTEKKPNNINTFIKKIYNFYSGWIRYKLIRLGRVPSHAYRKFYLKNIYLMKIEKNVVIYGGFEIRAPWNIKIGSGTVIGDEAKLDGRNGIIIGENVNVSTGVWIWTEQHDYNDPWFSAPHKRKIVIINDRAWISSRTTLLPGVQIGKGAVVASGAVVTKNCDEYGVYGGIPAKKIGNRNNDLKYEFDGSHLSFY